MSKAIAEAPQLIVGLGFYYKAFLDLGSCRSMGMGGEGRIPWMAVQEYAIRNGMEEDEFEDLWTLICLLDGAYLKYQSDHKPKPPTRTKG